MNGFLEYSPGDSIFHRMNPITKLAFALVICISAFMSRSLIFVAALIALDVLIGYVAGTGKRTLSLLKGLLKLSILLFVLQLLFVRDGTVLLSLPLGVEITTGGIKFALLVVARLTASTLPLATLLSVTKMNDLSGALVKRLYIPCKYAFAFTTAIRFIPVFADEMHGIIEAQTARGVEFDTSNPFKKMGLILPLCVPLLITSVKKIDGSSVSVEMRGFNCRKRENIMRDYKYSSTDAIAFCFMLLLIAASLLINRFI